MHDYDINDLDKDGVLKSGFSLIITMVFLTRQLFYGPVALLASRKVRGSSGAEVDLSWLAIHSYAEFAACLPALLMLIALKKRKVGAPMWVRNVWARGKFILLVGVAMQVSAMAARMTGNDFAIESSILIYFLLHIYLFIYLARSSRVKDVFSMFPEKTNSNNFL